MPNDEVVEPQTATGTDWRSALSSRIEELGRWTEGRYVLDLSPSMEVMPAVRLLEAETLRSAIARAATTTRYNPLDAAEMGKEDVDLRIALSRLTRHYCGAASIVALTALAHGVGVKLSASRCRLIFHREIPFRLALDIRPEEILLCTERPTTLPVQGRTVQTITELRSYVWRNLYANNVALLFHQALQITNVSPTLMWTNAAEWIALISDGADEYLGGDAAVPFVDDRRAAMSAPELPGIPGPNPLLGLVNWLPFDAPDFPHGVQERRMCCLTYLLDDRLGRLCQSCPFLPLSDRVALTRERHDVPMGARGGPAEQRAREIGLAKIVRR